MTAWKSGDRVPGWDDRDAPDPGRSNGKPEKRVCLDCDWRGKGIMAQAEHWGKTGHLIVYATDPRAKQPRLDMSGSMFTERPAGPWDRNGDAR